MKPIWREPYIICNLIFAVVLAVLLAYFGIFSSAADYPVHAVVSGTLTSTGLQRALSALVHGQADVALQLNPHSVRVFVFIVSQLLFRLIFSLIYIFAANRRRRLIIADAIISTLLFLWAFAPMAARQMIEGLNN
ncbi:MAG: hypothetical protein IKZ99_08430 [Salinivirgaceae bacterium]|nr:hypothetical protein [Salinivirgaceae bacterium]